MTMTMPTTLLTEEMLQRFGERAPEYDRENRQDEDQCHDVRPFIGRCVS